MATETREPKELAPSIVQKLGQLRSRIRLYVCLQGVAILIAAIGLAFWLTFGFDWLLSRQGGTGLILPLRIVAMVLIAIGLVILVVEYLLHRSMVPMSDLSMAVLLERRFKKFGDSLMTTVELHHSQHREAFNPDLLDRTYQDASSKATDVEVSQVFNTKPLWQAASAAMVLTLSVLIFALSASDAFGIYYQRWFGLKDVAWPRSVHLVVNGFDNNKTVKVARGGDFELSVKAFLNREDYPETRYPDLELPPALTIYSYSEGGSSSEANMRAIGEGKSDSRQYEHPFTSLVSSVEFDIYGGDAVARGYRIEVVESPKLADTKLFCQYPTYTQKAAQVLPASGNVLVPLGSKTVILATANKPLVRVSVVVQDAAGNSKLVEMKIPPEQKDKTKFQFPAGPTVPVDGELHLSDGQPTLDVDGDKTLIFTLYDEDGIHNSDPVRLTITAVPDEAPQMTIRLRGISPMITARARIPIIGDMSDDYGLDRSWFEYAIDDTPAKELDFTRQPKGRNEVAVTEAFDLLELAADKAAEKDPQAQPPKEGEADMTAGLLKRGQKFTLAIKGRDFYALEDKPHVTSSEKFPFEIVSEDELRTMLELRELNLRQRFEQIVSEMEQNYDSLLQMSTLKEELKPKPEEKPAAPPGCQDDPAKPEEAKPEEAPAPEAPPALTKEEILSERSLRVQRSMQDSKKNNNETLGVAQDFESMIDELSNNRIDSPDLKKRLQSDITDRLRVIAGEMFPEFDKRLALLETKLDDDAVMEPALDRALLQARTILTEMESVLDNMKRMEDFNELLTVLREIMAQQEAILKDTDRERLNQLRDLLD